MILLGLLIENENINVFLLLFLLFQMLNFYFGGLLSNKYTLWVYIGGLILYYD